MKKNLAIRGLFFLGAAYDGLIGAAFLLAAGSLYESFEVTPPNHWGYVHFPAALLIVFALMFLAVALRPSRNRNLIPYGILLKVSYCGVAGYHWVAGGIPFMWKPFFFCDLAFLACFAWAWNELRKKA